MEKNPGIVTGIPGSVSIAPVTGAAFATAATATAMASGSVGSGDDAEGTITQVETDTHIVPCTTISYSTWTVTVPQVAFTTDAAASESGSQSASTPAIGLIPGTTATATAIAATTATTTNQILSSSRIPNPWISSSTLITSWSGTPSSSSVTPSASSPLFTGKAARVEVRTGLGVGIGVVIAGLVF